MYQFSPLCKLDFTRVVWIMKGMGNLVGSMLIKSEMIVRCVCVVFHLWKSCFFILVNLCVHPSTLRPMVFCLGADVDISNQTELYL